MFICETKCFMNALKKNTLLKTTNKIGCLRVNGFLWKCGTFQSDYRGGGFKLASGPPTLCPHRMDLKRWREMTWSIQWARTFPIKNRILFSILQRQVRVWIWGHIRESCTFSGEPIKQEYAQMRQLLYLSNTRIVLVKRESLALCYVCFFCCNIVTHSVLYFVFIQMFQIYYTCKIYRGDNYHNFINKYWWLLVIVILGRGHLYTRVFKSPNTCW